MRSGVLAGVCAGSLLAGLELVLGAPDMLSRGAPWYGVILGLWLNWLVLVPVFALVGLMLSAGVRAWTGNPSDALGQRLEQSWSAMRQGSLAWHGWLAGLALVVAGILAAGGGLQVALNDSFHNVLLKGLLLTTLLGTIALVWIACVRAALRSANALLLRFLPARYRPALLLALVLTAIASLVVGALVARNTLAAIGWLRLTWLLVTPVALVSSWVGAILLRRRLNFIRWRAALLVLVAIPVGGVLGYFDAARVTLRDGTPSSIVMSLYQRATDFDGDGASMLFGGGDCAPFNRAIGPYAIDIPGNDIDENCTGEDASTAVRENERAFVPLPVDFPTQPDIILITVDALRADHSGFLGYERNTTPRLDRHVETGVIFERAYAQASGTVGSMPSLFTSKYFDQIHYTDERFPRTIGAEENLLAEALRGAGYETVGISSIRYTHKRAWGLLQGFETIDDELTHPDPAFKVTSGQTMRKGLAALEARKKSKRPVFLWVHFFDIHTEYLEHSGQHSFGKEKMDIYDGEILFTDRHVGELLDATFAERDRKQLVILTSDHGDGFKSDRGLMNHGYGLWNEQIHIPLVVWAPGSSPRRVDTPVANLDVMATALNAAGVRATGIMGHSLIPYLYQGFSDPDRIVFAIEPYREGAVWHERSVAIGARWKLHRFQRNGREALHDLMHDPGERKNVITKHPAIAAALRTELDGLVQQVDAYRHRSVAVPVSSASPAPKPPKSSVPAGSASAPSVR